MPRFEEKKLLIQLAHELSLGHGDMRCDGEDWEVSLRRTHHGSKVSSCHKIWAHGVRKGGGGGATWTTMRDASRVVRVRASSSSCWWRENHGGRGPVCTVQGVSAHEPVSDTVTATIRYDPAARNLCGDDTLSETSYCIQAFPLILIPSQLQEPRKQLGFP